MRIDGFDARYRGLRESAPFGHRDDYAEEQRSRCEPPRKAVEAPAAGGRGGAEVRDACGRPRMRQCFGHATSNGRLGGACAKPSRYFPSRTAKKQDVARAPLIANMFSVQLFIE